MRPVWTSCGLTNITFMNVMSLLFWDVTQRWLVVGHRRFGTTYLSHFRRSSSPRTLKIGPIGCPDRSVTLTQRCVTSQKSEKLIYTATEAWSQAQLYTSCSQCLRIRHRAGIVNIHPLNSTEQSPSWKAQLLKKFRGTRYSTSRKVAGSIPDGVTGIFQWLNPSGRIVALGSTQSLT